LQHRPIVRIPNGTEAMRWPWQRKSEIKLDQPANVFWIANNPERRSFESVTDAVRFVMEDIAPHRASAWIVMDDTTVTAEQIERLYKKHCRTKSS
jgi:hypothetical protein